MDYNHVIENIGKVIDAAGVAVIVVGMLISTGAAVIELSRHESGIYRHFRQQLGRTILNQRFNRYSRPSNIFPATMPKHGKKFFPNSSREITECR